MSENNDNVNTDQVKVVQGEGVVSSAEEPKASTPEPRPDNIEEKRPVVENKAIPLGMQSWPHYSFLNNGFTQAATDLNGINKDEDERFAAMQWHYPRALLSDKSAEEGSQWVQHIEHGGKLIGPQAPRLRSNGGNLKGRAALEALRRNSAIGGTLTFELFRTGIVVTMEPAKESRFIDLEFTMQHQATQVGLSTTGLLLNARSGVFSDAMIRMALGQVISTNYQCDNDHLVESLMDIIDPLDYGTLIWGVMATKFANGHPWSFMCTSIECEAVENVMMNFARGLWVNKAALCTEQLDILSKTSKSIDLLTVQKYRDLFNQKIKNEVELSDGTVIVFGRSNLTTMLEATGRWVKEIEASYNAALTNYATEKQRTAYLDGIIQTRRMLKYEHFVQEIKIPGALEGEYTIIDDRETIRDGLMDLSTLSDNAEIFEEAADEYIEASTIVLFGYRARKCQSCGHDPAGEVGQHRAIVPIAIDHLLFMLVQQRNMAFARMGQE